MTIYDGRSQIEQKQRQMAEESNVQSQPKRRIGTQQKDEKNGYIKGNKWQCFSLCSQTHRHAYTSDRPGRTPKPLIWDMYDSFHMTSNLKRQIIVVSVKGFWSINFSKQRQWQRQQTNEIFIWTRIELAKLYNNKLNIAIEWHYKRSMEWVAFFGLLDFF